MRYFTFAKGLELFRYNIENEKSGGKFCSYRKRHYLCHVNDIQRGHRDVRKRQIIATD